MKIEIREGRPQDADFISKVVTEAIGEELILGLAGSRGRIPLVKKLFSALGADSNSQYSYTNTLVAVNELSVPVGGIIAYDGAGLHELRRAFVREANAILGWEVTEEEAENWGDEADSGEIYIDSLYVDPDARRHGVATALLKGVENKFRYSGKPLGLLVEPSNDTALKAYSRWGFKKKGISNFFQTPMIHMQM